jgi:hypothetical protein
MVRGGVITLTRAIYEQPYQQAALAGGRVPSKSLSYDYFPSKARRKETCRKTFHILNLIPILPKEIFFPSY